MESKLDKVLKLQDQGITRNEIFKAVGYSRLDNLTKMMKKNGYKFNDIEKKYVLIDNQTKDEPVTIYNNQVVDFNNNEMKEKIIRLTESCNEIEAMLHWYKTVGGQLSSNEKTEVIEVIHKGIQIDLPKVDSIKTSIRVNKDVWREFGEFAEEHSEFVKGDLICQALKEFMEKHR